MTKFELQTDVLESLLTHEDVREKRVVVISVTGAFRTGKSFLLNYLIRYLTHLESGGEGNWLGGEEDELTGFTWRRGADPETAGIMAWNRMFQIKSGDEQIAVLLLDTQGAFDDDSDVKDVTLIFSLSTMISSCQIYNVRGNLQSDNLQHLQLFTEFGRQAMSEEISDRPPFQNLLFLIRDWNLDDTEGYEGGANLLKKRLEVAPKMNEEKRELRQHIRSCFKSIEAFLMPHPGDVVRKGEFKGESSKLHPDFLANLRVLVPSLLDKPETKVDVAGNRLTCSQLSEYFKRYTRLFQNEDMPETVTILEATAEANHHMAVQKATNVWKNESEQMIPESGYLSAKAFDEKSAQLMEKSLSTFDGTKRMLSAKYGKQYRDDLEQDILSKMDVMRKLNDEKRAAKLLQTPLILIFTVLVAWFAIFILELFWLSPVAAWINLVSMFLILCLVIWVVDQYQGGLGVPIQENVDSLADMLKTNILMPLGMAAHRGISRTHPDTANMLQSLLMPKEKRE